MDAFAENGNVAIEEVVAHGAIVAPGVHLRSSALWALPEARKIVARQNPDGSWRYPGGNLSHREGARSIGKC